MYTKKLNQLSLLTSMALIIFILETQIPLPFALPGIKLGLANIITVYAIYKYTSLEVLFILLTRIILGSIFSGNLVSISYSFVGGMFCFLGMILCKQIISINYIWLCSIIGAILHNLGQIITAIFLTNTPDIIVYFPLLFISACISGTFTGLIAKYLIKRINHLNITT